MAKYRTAMGKTIDMAALQARNEKTRAVGNMKVNARGDTIDSQGRVIKPVTSKATSQYSNTVGNKSSHVVNKPQQPKSKKPQVEEELTEFEKELDSNLDEELEIEKIKAQETKK